MKLSKLINLSLAAALVAFGLWVLYPQQSQQPEMASPELVEAAPHVHVDGAVMPARAEIDGSAWRLGKPKPGSKVRTALYETPNDPGYSSHGVFVDDAVELCQGSCGCEGGCSCGGGVAYADGYGGGQSQSLGSKFLKAVGVGPKRTREGRWVQARSAPWEQYAYGEYVGPYRTPHVPEYRLRVGDDLEFVYLITRRQSSEPYRFYVGDEIRITSAGDPNLNQVSLVVLSDGTVSLPLIGLVRVAGKTISNLQRELNDRYADGFVKNPEIVVQVVSGDTPLQDLRDAVDARAGNGGQSRLATVAPDGTVQLPLVGSIPAIGLSLKEIAREINARYRILLGGIEVTPILIDQAPSFIYVVGEVNQPGRFDLTGPTSSMQAIALAGGFTPGGNLRQMVVFRRDANWQLVATRLDLAAAMFGRRPQPADEIWLRDSDIVLIPKKPIQRLSEAVNQYLATTIYAIFPQQGVAFNFDDFTPL